MITKTNTIKTINKSNKNRKYRLYICHCGNKLWKRIDNPVYENSSCGCTRYDWVKNNSARRTHGLSKTKIYYVWINLKNRCDNPKYRLYKDYGGRGISYDPSWSKFENFYADVGSGYKEGLAIDRIDNNGNYHKDNCRWVSNKVNNNNKRNNVIIKYNGEERTVAEWSRKLGIKYRTIYSRIYKYGWSINKALNTK